MYNRNYLQRNIRGIIRPRQHNISRNKKMYTDMWNHKGNFKNPTLDPVLDELSSKRNLEMLQKRLTDYYKNEKDFTIPLQNLDDIRETIEQIYHTHIQVPPKIQFDVAVGTLQRIMRGHDEHTPVNLRSELGPKKETNKPDIMRTIRIVNDLALKKMIKFVDSEILKHKRYFDHHNTPYVERLRRRWGKRYTKQAPKKEVMKYWGNDHHDHSLTRSKYYKPRFYYKGEY